MEAEKINGEQFKKLIESGETFVVDFYADWCGPCQMFLPVFKAQAKETDVKMVMINIDDDGEAASNAGVQGVPTVQVYKGGKKVLENVGFLTPDQLKDLINQI